MELKDITCNLKSEKVALANKIKVKKNKKVEKFVSPLYRIHYKNVQKYFYSFKYECWFEKTSVVGRDVTPKGKLYSCKLINIVTREILEEISGGTKESLKERVLNYINDSKLF